MTSVAQVAEQLAVLANINISLEELDYLPLSLIFIGFIFYCSTTFDLPLLNY